MWAAFRAFTPCTGVRAHRLVLASLLVACAVATVCAAFGAAPYALRRLRAPARSQFCVDLAHILRPPPGATPAQHIAFHKSHKTASSTLAAVLHRGLARHNLSELRAPTAELDGVPCPMRGVQVMNVHTVRRQRLDRGGAPERCVPSEVRRCFRRPPLVFTAVREPASHLFSWYYYFVQPEHAWHAPAASVNDVLRALRRRALTYDLQTRELLGACAQPSLRAYDAVTVAEQFDRSVLLLTRQFGWSAADGLYIPAKMGERRRYDGRRLLPRSRRLGAATRAVASRRLANSPDGRLYRDAEARLARDAAEWGVSDGRVAAFSAMQAAFEAFHAEQCGAHGGGGGGGADESDRFGSASAARSVGNGTRSHELGRALLVDNNDGSADAARLSSGRYTFCRWFALDDRERVRATLRARGHPCVPRPAASQLRIFLRAFVTRECGGDYDDGDAAAMRDAIDAMLSPARSNVCAARTSA